MSPGAQPVARGQEMSKTLKDFLLLLFLKMKKWVGGPQDELPSPRPGRCFVRDPVTDPNEGGPPGGIQEDKAFQGPLSRDLCESQSREGDFVTDGTRHSESQGSGSDRLV